MHVGKASISLGNGLEVDWPAGRLINGFYFIDQTSTKHLCGRHDSAGIGERVPSLPRAVAHHTATLEGLCPHQLTVVAVKYERAELQAAPGRGRLSGGASAAAPGS